MCRATFPDGRGLFECEFEGEEHEAAQKIPGIIVLPSLTTPASKLPQKVFDWLASHGVTPQPDDTVLNVLRALRDKFGASFAVDLSA